MSSGSDGQIYRSVRISLAQGLSQSTVYGIAQDSPGFLWVATQDGLNKYDGNSFETYYNQPFDSASIPSSNVMTVFCDSKNRLWVGTMNSGLSLSTERLNHLLLFPKVQGKVRSTITLFLQFVKMLMVRSGLELLLG